MATRSLPALLLVGLLAVGLSDGGAAPATSTADGYDQVVGPVLARHGCTPAGFGAVERPRGALVRTPGGRLTLVSPARGRAVYDGRRPGVLVALCAGRPGTS